MRNNIWTKKELKILRDHYPSIEDPRKLVKMIGRPYSAISAKAVKMGIHRQFHRGPWTLERQAKLVKLYPNHTVAQTAKLLNVPEAAVIAKAFKLKLRKDPAFWRECAAKGFFKKGQEPANKGRKVTEWMSEQGIERTAAKRFKKGHIPKNYKPVGSERINVEGYVEVKIKDPNKWEPKHRVVYQHHYGHIPHGKLVKFKDGNKLNFDPANLYLSDRVENMQANTYHNYPKEIANLIQIRGALNRQINKHEKHK